MKTISLFIILFSLISHAKEKTRNFIVDTDMGIDDVIAIIYLLKNPQINVMAITISSTGNAHCPPAYNNLLAILKLMKKKIPITCGSPQPLSGNHHFPKSVLIESDTLGGAALSLPKSTTIPTYNSTFLLKNTIINSREPVEILAIGPLTNIALSLKSYQELKKKIKRIYIMGGAINVPGNLSDSGKKYQNKSAEWNIYIDPEAASFILNQDIPITLIPIDVTNKYPITPLFHKKLLTNKSNLLTNFISKMLDSNKTAISKHQWFFWDPLAAFIAVNQDSYTIKEQKLGVVVSPEIKSGTIVYDKKGRNIQIVENVSSSFEDELLLKLNS